jgi:uncharacterized RDD family membrane protein YckC
MTAQYDEILIGEGVRLESGSAPVTLRAVSAILDAIAVVILLTISINLLEPIAMRVNEALATAITITLVVWTFVLLPAIVETITRGRSLGKAAVGIRIVRDDGGPVSFRHAFLRALVGLIEIYGTVGTVAGTISLVSTKGKRAGDFLAGTYALRTRGGTRTLPPVAMPPSLVDWAETADIRRLPDGLALTARLLLSRAATLRPEARVRLGNLIGSEIDRFVAPPPPDGTHVETYIAAVLATRRDREYVLAVKQASRAFTNGEAMRRLPHGVPDVEN